MRIVSLTCSNTEIVCSLNCGHMLVGVDADSDFPEEVVSQLPRVGRDLDIEVEKVAALKPDLVIASLTVPGHEKVIERLEQAGLKYIAPEPVSLEDVYDNIREIAELLDVSSRGEAVIEAMREDIHSEKNTSDTSPSILVQWWPKPVIAPGKQSWVNDLIIAAGAINPLGQQDCKSKPLEDHEIISLDPDAIVISWCGVSLEKYRPEVIYRNEAWQSVQAIKNQQVHCITEAFLGRPSPRLVDGFKQLKEIVSNLANEPS